MPNNNINIYDNARIAHDALSNPIVIKRRLDILLLHLRIDINSNFIR